MERETLEASDPAVNEAGASEDLSGGQPAASLTSDLIERGRANFPITAAGLGDTPGHGSHELKNDRRSELRGGNARPNQLNGSSASADMPMGSARTGHSFHFGGIRMRDVALIGAAYVIFLALLIALIPD